MLNAGVGLVRASYVNNIAIHIHNNITCHIITTLPSHSTFIPSKSTSATLAVIDCAHLSLPLITPAFLETTRGACPEGKEE